MSSKGDATTNPIVAKAGVPGLPYRPRGVRGLTGDRRKCGPNESVQLIDCEWDVPGFFMIQTFGYDNGLGQPQVEWTLRIGVDRAVLHSQTFSPSYSGPLITEIAETNMARFIMARSVSLVARCLDVGVIPLDQRGEVAALVAPIDNLNYEQFANRANIGATPFMAPVRIGDIARTSGTVAVPDALIATQLVGGGASNRVSIFNNSGGNLFIKPGDGVSLAVWAVKIPPGGYFECPWDYNGEIWGIWDADTGGAAMVTGWMY